jgi:hypothetical protein
MSFCAYHRVSRTIQRDRKRDERYWPLIIKGNAYAEVVNLVFISSAKGLDRPKTGPFDLIQEEMASLAENGLEERSDGGFTLDNQDLLELEDDILSEFPDHPDTKKAIQVLKDIRKQDKAGSPEIHEFVCF